MEKRRTHCYSLQETGVTCPAEARGFMSHRNLLREQPQHCCWGPSEVRNARFQIKAATGQNRDKIAGTAKNGTQTTTKKKLRC